MTETTETTERKYRTITLTGRPPVRIVEDQWPVIAHGQYSDHDGQVESQANRRWLCDICVRRHEDGRAIVYGVYRHNTAWRGESSFAVRCGVLLAPGGGIPEAIREIAASLRDAADEAGHEFAAHIHAAARDAVADLPAETI